ncbi:MAG: hypothetical protein ACPHL6_05045, partial [Rubripirellula sp.]
MKLSRRSFNQAALSAAALGSVGQVSEGSQLSDSPPAAEVEVLLPRNRVPLSFIIDDSTCLVNMGHYCTPQFATAWPNRSEYQKPWQKWPREIP